jgi:hypothetical protein
VQTLKLRFAHRVEIDARRLNDRSRALQPTEENLGCARVTDRPLAQPTLDFCVAGPLTVTTCGAALAAQPCRLARLLLRPTVGPNSVLMSFDLSDSVSFVQLAVGRREPVALELCPLGSSGVLLA